jgi:hypothetical protein
MICKRCKRDGEMFDFADWDVGADVGICRSCWNASEAKSTGRLSITEANEELIESWFVRAKEVDDPQQLVAFMEDTVDGYQHDYGTTCHALAACAVAATTCANRMEGARGGITGFQANATAWMFVRRMLLIEGPVDLVLYRNALFPQYESQFAGRPIARSAMEWLQTEARKRLAEQSDMHERVRAHMESIAGGIPPFGMTVED